jgi:hypothetical protein
VRRAIDPRIRGQRGLIERTARRHGASASVVFGNTPPDDLAADERGVTLVANLLRIRALRVRTPAPRDLPRRAPIHSASRSLAVTYWPALSLALLAAK